MSVKQHKIKKFTNYLNIIVRNSPATKYFSILAVRLRTIQIHRRRGNFFAFGGWGGGGGGGGGGAVKHMPKKISQVAQNCTKESKRNEGHIATT